MCYSKPIHITLFYRNAVTSATILNPIDIPQVMFYLHAHSQWLQSRTQYISCRKEVSDNFFELNCFLACRLPGLHTYEYVVPFSMSPELHICSMLAMCTWEWPFYSLTTCCLPSPVGLHTVYVVTYSHNSPVSRLYLYFSLLATYEGLKITVVWPGLTPIVNTMIFFGVSFSLLIKLRLSFYSLTLRTQMVHTWMKKSLKKEI